MANPHKKNAITLALLVTFLWATSWVLVKLGLDDLPPLTFAGLRYFLGFLILMPFAVRKKSISEIRTLSSLEWRYLILLGLVYYTINQGAIFAALAILPAVAVSMILSFTSMVTAGIAIAILSEKASWMQWVGILLNLSGAYLYFYPVNFPKHQWMGILLAFIGMMANSVSTVLGRKVNRLGKVSSIVITTISMGIGATALLAAGLFSEKLPVLTLSDLLLLGVLAVVNTALAFTLWNKALQRLEAIEASVINNLVAFQIAVLAWIFLGENLSGLDVIGIVLAVFGAILVQMRPNPQTGT
jgi:drug/metabolite transporter (DMT)-like permease